MFSGDEFYDDEITSGAISVAPDPREAADFRIAELKDTSSCSKCGSREPVRIESGVGCSDCTTFPRCDICQRWIGDGSGWLPGYRIAMDHDGSDIKVCDVCWKDEPDD